MKIYVQLCLAELLERDVSDKSCRKNENIFMLKIFFLLKIVLFMR